MAVMSWTRRKGPENESLGDLITSARKIEIEQESSWSNFSGLVTGKHKKVNNLAHVI